MTTIIRSDRASPYAIDNLHGFYGPMDFTGLLDFNLGEYYTVLNGQRVNYSLNQAVSVTRNRTAEYLDTDGVYRIAGVNEPRLQYMPDLGVRGLLGEEARTNMVLQNVNPPATQDVSIIATAGALLYLSWQGSGSPSLSSANLTQIHAYGQVKVYQKSVTTAFVAQLNIAGTVTKVQAEISSNGPFATTFITGDAPRTRPADFATLGSAFVSLIAGDQCTLVGNYVRYYTPSINASVPTGSLFVKKTGEGLGGICLTNSVNALGTPNGTDTIQTLLPNGTFNSGVTRATLSGPYNRRSVRSLSWGAGGSNLGFTAYRNAQTVEGTDYVLTPPDIVGLTGGGGQSATTNAFTGILTHLLIYPRRLTAVELQKCAQQWQ